MIQFQEYVSIGLVQPPPRNAVRMNNKAASNNLGLIKVIFHFLPW